MIENPTIPLTQNACAIVDPEDFGLLDEHKWWLRATSEHLRYAARKENGKMIYMHRQILNTPAGMHTDHINGNGLDNRKSNLRICTPTQNQHNSVKWANKSSRFKGVSWNKQAGKWEAYIRFNTKLIHLGRYYIEVDAAEAYDKKAAELFGEFANLNFPSQKAKLISEKKQNENAGLSELFRPCSPAGKSQDLAIIVTVLTIIDILMLNLKIVRRYRKWKKSLRKS